MDIRAEIRTVRYDHPDAVALTERVQQEYVLRYGEPDATPMDPAHFDPPNGLFLVCYLDGDPVATGGWRAKDASRDGHEDGDAELKRMFVVPEARGRGLARRVLAELETSAATAGRRRMVLETGELQPEAISLYTSCGYTPVAKFGVYRDAPLSVHLGRPLTGVGALPERSEAR
ncbi:GNAT family N-acetyltransferase [Streptomyces sp. RPT161]|uniref:GNAT family N-acetyltransferase n=1 Tax=Streptomyces sp. RPT161 TaxID=3015993 RepID=UPI0022B9201A|nr:GNAT family N-acetyltransferase [Streptomyces sp. RPT161]